MFQKFGALAVGGLVFAAAGPALADPPPVEAYGRLPAIEAAKLSPSGRLIAYITTEHDARILVVGPPGGEPLEALKVGDAKVREVAWAGDDHVLVTLTTTMNLGYYLGWNHELASVISINPRTHKVVSVFAGVRRVAPAVFGQYGTLFIDGRWYGYFGGISVTATNSTHEITHGYPDLYRVDLDTGAVAQVASGTERTRNWVVNAKGEVIAHSDYDQGSHEWRVLTGGINGQVLLSGKDPFGGAELALGRTQDTILIEHMTDAGTAYTEMPVAGGPTKDLPDSGTIAEILSDPPHGWRGLVREGDLMRTEMLDPTWRRSWRTLATPSRDFACIWSRSATTSAG